MLERSQIEASLPSTGAAYQVIVAGGGPAGLGAALAAATHGARTLLLEARSFFGGVAAVALWMPMNRILLDGGSRGGVHEQFVRKIRSYGAEASTEGVHDFFSDDNLNVHPDYLRLAFFELLEEAGCHYQLYSPVTGVLMDGRAVRGVVVTGKEGPQEFRAHVVIDATGDGDVAYLAGAEVMEGREEDGMHMPVSLVFALGNVDVDRLEEFKGQHELQFKAILEQAAAEGYCVAAWYSFDRGTIPGVVSVNNGAMAGIGDIDASRSGDLTVAERVGIQVAVDFVRLARAKRIPGLENCCLMRVGAAVGVRDTRRVVGDYVLTVDDARTAPDFPDVVARKYGVIDANQLFIGEMKSGFGYPFRSMLPKGIENLLVAGRCGSATFLGHAAGKSMGNMMALGQAAGVAAALACREGVSPRQIDVHQVQDALRAMGVRL